MESDTKISSSDKRLLTARVAARRLACAPDYISKLCREGKLVGERINNAWYVSEESLIAFNAVREEARNARAEELTIQRRRESKAYQYANSSHLQRVVMHVQASGKTAGLSLVAGVMLLCATALVTQAALGSGIISAPKLSASLAHVDSPFFVSVPTLPNVVGDMQSFFAGLFAPTKAPVEIVYAPAQNIPVTTPTPTAPATTTYAPSQTIVENKTYPVIERIVATSTNGASQQYVDEQLNELRSLIAGISTGPSSPVLQYAPAFNINKLQNVALTNVTVSGVSGLTAADIPHDIIASNYLPLTGGTLTGSLSLVSASTSATSTLAGIQLVGTNCSQFNNGGKLTTDSSGNVICGDDASGSGSGSPGGANTQVQFNDSGSFGGNAGFTFVKAAQRLTVTNASTTAFSSTYASSTSLFAGTLTLSTALTVPNGGTGSTTLGGILAGNGTDAVTSATVSSPLSFSGNTLSIQQATASQNGYLSSTDWSTFNNKISSTSLSAGAGISYNSATGVIINTIGYDFPSNATSTALTFNGGLTASNILATGSTTLQNFTALNATTSQATTTNLAITGISSSLLKTLSNGAVVAAVAGTDYQAAGNYATFGYLFPSNATSTQIAFNGGLTASGATTTNLSTTLASTTNLVISSAGGTGTRCLQVGADGTVSANAFACGTGSGSSFGQAFEINGAGYLAPTTTITLLANGGFVSQASSTVVGGLTVAGNATSTNFAITAVASSLLKTNSLGQVLAATAGTDYITPAGLASAYPFQVSGNATSTLTQFNGGLTAFASSTIGNGNQNGGLTISGGATTTGNALIQGVLNLANALTVPNGGTGSTTLGGILAGNGTDAVTSATVSSPLSFSGNTLSIQQATASQNGYLSSTDWSTFNNKISSTSLSAGAGISYNSATGVIINTIGYPFPSNATSTQIAFNGGLTAFASSTVGNGTQTGGLTISGGATTTGNSFLSGNVGIGIQPSTRSLEVSGTAKVSSTFTLGSVTSCTGSEALQTNGSGDISCGTIATGGASSGGGWNTDNIGHVTLSTTTDAVGIGATTTPYAKLSVVSSSVASTTLALVPASAATANILDIYDTSGVLASVLTASQRLGIATTSPGSTLSVGGSGYFSGALGVSGQTTLQNFTALNATTSQATTTNIAVTSLANVLLSTNAQGSVLGATVSSPLSFSGNTLSIQQATASQNGYLSSTDWSTFNNKISSTSLSSANGFLSYNSSTGVFTGSTTPTYTAATSTNFFATNLTVGTLSGLLKATSGVVSTATAGTDYQVPLTFTYPLQNVSNTVSLAFGTSTSNTWGGTQTFTNAPIISNFSGLIAANSGSTYAAATSSLGIGGEFAYSGTLGALVGGANGTLTLSTNGVALTKLAQIPANTILGDNTGATGNVVAFATSTLGIALSDTTGTLAVNRGGTGQTSFTAGNLLYGAGGGSLQNVGTSSLAVDSSLSVSGSLGAQVGGTNSTISLNTANANIWSALQTFGNILVTGSSTFQNFTALNATTSQATTTNLAVTGVTSSLLKTLSNGTVVAATAGTDYITPAGLASAYPFQVSGNATSTLTQFNGGLTAFASSTIGNGNQNGGLTISGGATTTGNALIQGVLNLANALTVPNGGTGSTTLGGILAGNGTGAVKSVVVGSGLTFDGTTLSTNGSGITALGPAGQTQTGGTQTLATTTSSFNGLTSAITIVGNSNTQTFTPTLSGTLGVGGGGTGQTSFSSSQLLYGAGGGALQSVATSSLATDASLSVAGTLGTLVGGTAATLSLNTAHSNFFTALQNFTNASTSQFTATSSVYLATLGGSVGIGNASPTKTLDVTGTGKFSSTLTLGGTLSCSGGSALQTNGSGDISCGTVSLTGISTAGGWTTNNIGLVKLATTTDQVLIGAISTSTLSQLEVHGGATIDNATTTNFAASGVAYFGGSVGVGTTSPSTKLSVNGGTILQVAAGNPTVAATLSTSGASEAAAVEGNYLYTAEDGAGLVITDITNPAVPTTVGSYSGLSAAVSVAVAGKYAYVGDNSTGLNIIDVSNPTSPTLVGSYSIPFPHGVAVSGKYAYVTDGNNGILHIIDVSNPTAPVQAGKYAFTGAGPSTYPVVVQGKYAYVGEQTNGVVGVIDISNPAAPVKIGSYASSTPSGLYVSGKYLYVADDSVGFYILNVSNPASPAYVGSYKGSGSYFGVAVAGDYAYLADHNGAATVVDVHNPVHPTLVGSVSTGGTPWSIAVAGIYAYLPSDTAGTAIVGLSGTKLPTANIGALASNNINVSDNVQVGGDLSIGGGIDAGISGIFSRGTIAAYVASSTQINPVVANFIGGNVGIGTTSPFATLSVVGNIFGNNITGTNVTATGTLAVSGLSTLIGGILTNASSTLGNFTALNATTSQATTTSFAITGISSSLLKTLTSGAVVAAVAGTDYVSPSGLASAYPFQVSGNATSTLTQFNGGLTAYATSTIGDGTQTGGLTISGGATTTANAYFGGSIGIDAQPISSTVLTLSTTSNIAARGASITNTYVGASSVSTQGINAFAFSQGTANNAITASGGGLRNRYVVGNETVGYNVSQMSAVSAFAEGIGTLSSTTNATDFNAEVPSITAGNTITNFQGVWVHSGAVSGLTNQVGVDVENLTAATNNTEVLLGTATIPSGNFGLYQSDTNNNYFAGNVGLGTTSPFATLSVAGNIFANGTITGSNLTATGTLAVSGLSTLTGGILTNASSTLGNFTALLATTTQATTTSLAITGISSSLLKTLSNGAVVAAVAGTDYAAGNVAYPFQLTGNATSTLTQFNGGLTAFASSTIGSGTQGGGLTISGGATTTGSAYFVGNVGVGTTSPFAQFSVFAGGDYGSHSASTLFAIGSTTAGTATTTLFSVNSAGNATLAGLFTAPNFLATASSTFQNFTGLNATTTQATTTNLAVSGISSSLLKTLSNGAVVAAVAGTDYAAGNVAYPFQLTGNATSTLTQFNGGLTAVGATTTALAVTGSSTISSILNVGGSLNANNGLAVSGSVSLPANSLTLSEFPTIGANTIIGNLTGGTATPTAFATSSLFAGTAGQVGYFSGTGALVGTSTLFLNTNSQVGVGTTTPWAKLSVDTSNLAAGVPEFDIGSSTRTDLVVTQAGNVGIGTSNPGSALEVAGNIGLTSGSDRTISVTAAAVATNGNALTVAGGAATGSGTRTGGNLVLEGGVGANSGSGGTVYISGGSRGNTSVYSPLLLGALPGGTSFGAVGIGTTTAPSSELTVGTTGGETIGADYNVAAPSNGLLVEGNVGIGTTSPYAQFSINAQNGSTNTTLFQISSSTLAGTATNSLLSFNNTGGLTIGSNSSQVSSSTQLSVLLGTSTVTRISQSNLANAGFGNSSDGIAMQGRYAYVVEGGGNSNAFEIFDVSNPAAPTRISQTSFPFPLDDNDGDSISVQGKYAYIITGGSNTDPTFFVYDISNPQKPVLTGSAVTGSFDWSTVYVAGRYAYVAIGGSTAHGFEIFDISNPSMPNQVADVALTNGANAGGQDGIYVQNGYAYIAEGGGSSNTNDFEIFNVSNPASPIRVSQSTLANYGDGGNGGDSIYIQGRYAYIAEGGALLQSSVGFEIWDISNPASPSRVSQTNLNKIGQTDGIFVQGRYAYIAEGGGTANTFQIFDVSNPASPVQASQNNLAQGNINTGGGDGIVVQGRYAYIAEGSGTTNAFEIFDLGGEYAQQLEAGGIETGTLSVRNDLSALDGNFAGGLTAGGSLSINGSGSFTSATSTFNTTANIFNITTASSTSPIFNVLGNGNVGIGTSSPNSNLSVQGNGLFSGNLSVAGLTATGTAAIGTLNLTNALGLASGGTGTTTGGVTNAVEYYNGTTLTNNANFTFNPAVSNCDGGTCARLTLSNPFQIFTSFNGGSRFIISSSTANDDFIGTNAGSLTGGYNAGAGGGFDVAFGRNAMSQITTGYQNVAIGSLALTQLTTGNSDLAVGSLAGQNFTTASNDIAFGNQAFSVFATSSNDDIAIGSQALTRLKDVGTACDGVAGNGWEVGVGAFVGQFLSFGCSNTIIGGGAGQNLTTGSNNIVIGADPALNSYGPSTGSNNIIIGYNNDLPNDASSNQLDIGNIIYGTGLTSTGSTVSSGSIGIGTSTPWRTLSVTGTVSFNGLTSSNTGDFVCLNTSTEEITSGTTCTLSSQKVKNNIATSTTGLVDILKLNPVTFNYDQGFGDNGSTTQVGLIAEQVAVINPLFAEYATAPIPTPNGTINVGDPDGINWNAITDATVGAIQELNLDLETIASTTASSTPASQSFAASFWMAVKNQITNLLGDAGNGIANIFTQTLTATTVNAQVVNTQKLCIGSTCVTEAQLQQLLQNEAQGGNSSGSSSSSGSVSSSNTGSSTPPTITLNGNNPATINIGDVYTDLGGTISGPGTDANLQLMASVDGAATTTADQIQVDTSAVGTHTIIYSATDGSGLTGYASREVDVVASSTQP